MKIRRDIEIERLKRNLISLAEEQKTLKIRKKKNGDISFSGIIKIPKDLFSGIALNDAKAGDIVTVRI
jgi:hypothetical protein